jgi:hypothetical protein
MLKSALAGCDDALDVFENAPVGEGSTAFAHLRHHCELLSSNVKEKFRKQTENLKPIAGEDPLRVISRINKLYVKHGKTINPETQSEEAKIRRVLHNCAKFQSLSIKIKMIRAPLSSGEREARKMPCTYITEEIAAEWLSFGEGDSVQINSMSVAEIAAMRAEMVHGAAHEGGSRCCYIANGTRKVCTL